MIIEGFFNPLFSLIMFIISLMGVGGSFPDWSISFMELIQQALCYFPARIFVVSLLNIYSWIMVRLTWSIIEWVYKKFPGVD